MDPQEKFRIKLIYFALAYSTIFFYLLIISILLYSLDTEVSSQIILSAFLVPAAFSVLFSTIIIKKNLETTMNLTRGLILLSIAHLPALLGLATAFILIDL
ncbi:MAG: hypothetical protein Q7I99_04015 [Acholeplasmataceae bacterium]|nr:hypothetical protein [Acholeplasmataceae bacterium]